MLRQIRPGGVKQRFWRFFVHAYLDFWNENKKFCNILFCALICRRGLPSFSTIDKTMKMLGAKEFGVVFRTFFFFLKEFLKKNQIDQRMKFRRTNKVGKFEVKKVKSKGAVRKMSFVSRSLHAPLSISFLFSLLCLGEGVSLDGKQAWRASTLTKVEIICQLRERVESWTSLLQTKVNRFISLLRTI